MIFKYKFIIITIILTGCFALTQAVSQNITASNSWTKAFAEAAGVEAEQIASANLKHPPEYELKPSDVIKINNSDLFIYAGYEVMMKTVFESFKKPEDQLIKIKTSYVPGVLEKSILKIADKTGTEEYARISIAEYKKEFRLIIKRLQEKGLFGKPVIVQFHLKPLIKALGFEIIGVIGPSPLEVRDIAEMSRLNPSLIIDNAHNPSAAPITEVTGAETIRLINFPGFLNNDGTLCPDSLIGVLKYNAEILIR